MRTEFDFGYDFAADQGTEPADIERILGSSSNIPPDDYRAMKKSGIENPDPRKYWEGYNSYFKK